MRLKEVDLAAAAAAWHLQRPMSVHDSMQYKKRRCSQADKITF